VANTVEVERALVASVERSLRRASIGRMVVNWSSFVVEFRIPSTIYSTKSEHFTELHS